MSKRALTDKCRKIFKDLEAIKNIILCPNSRENLHPHPTTNFNEVSLCSLCFSFMFSYIKTLALEIIIRKL